MSKSPRALSPSDPEYGVFRAHVASRTVGLCPEPGRYPIPVNEIPLVSGALLRFRGFSFVVTAAHSFAKISPTRFHICFPGSDGGQTATSPEAAKTFARENPPNARSVEVPFLGIIVSTVPALDLAAMHVSGDSIPAHGRCGNSDEGEGGDPVAGEGLVALGDPIEAGLFERDEHGKYSMKAVPFFIGGDVLEGSADVAFPDFDAEIHFFFKYDMKQNPQGAIEPGGMSGCGIWRLRNFEGKPRADLIGILTRYDYLSGRFLATRWSALRKLLEDYCSERTAHQTEE